MGIGVQDVHEAWNWYAKTFGMDIPVFEEAATAGLMLPYTGNQPQDRHAILALSLQGGGGFEIWQYTSRTPQAANFDVKLGDLGLYGCKMKCLDIHEAHRQIDKTYLLSKDIEKGPNGTKHFFVKDPFGNVFQVIEDRNTYAKTKSAFGGVFGAIIGVSDIERSIEFYRNILGYDQITYQGEDHFNDFKSLPNGKSRFKRAILRHSEVRQGPFSELLGQSEIELICFEGEKNTIFENRFWGDLGYIHLCFDVTDMAKLKEHCEANGSIFTVDSSDSFDMGEAAGHFSYIEDPDGALIEFVETHKIPIAKKLGWYVNLKNRKDGKPLPKWMLKSLSLNRKKS